MANTAENQETQETKIDTSKITCQVCGELCHSIQIHIKEAHLGEITLDEYKEEYPDAPLLSEMAKAKVQAKLEEKVNKTEMKSEASSVVSLKMATKKAMHDIFGLRKSASVLNSKGDPIMISVLPSHDYQELVPNRDENYVFPVDILKVALMGLEMNIPTFLYGHAGLGKSTIWEQIAHATNRPMIRVQHTGSTEESHILGSMCANEHGTYFEPGPLAMAMKYGWLYLADEYDFAFPQVMAVYQPVLEGKPLIIKEAPSEWRVVKPHKDFRIVATGNTNGAGDDTGLYQGTNVQNAANFERFGIVEEVPYMDKREETKIVMQQARLKKEHADLIAQFAKLVREAFRDKKIGYTIGPRVMINIGKLWIARGSAMQGAKLAFINRLPESDRQVVTDLAQRVFDK